MQFFKKSVIVCPLVRFFLIFALSQQADLALQEAIRIAQESNDHVCLQHCLVKKFKKLLLLLSYTLVK